MVVPVSKECIEKIGRVLLDEERPLKERFRALFTLKNLNEIEPIGRCFRDSSALLKHECAYCLGQTRNSRAQNILEEVLKDDKQEPIVRHEAGEALGAIGECDSLPLLQEFSKHSDPVIAETCQLAVQKIKWVNSIEASFPEFSSSPFCSVDPAPPLLEKLSVSELQNILKDSSKDLWTRYRAMFSLRNNRDEESVLALCKSLKCPSSALFRHEVAYVLGQLQHPASIQYLKEVLEDTTEMGMVRHECAEALGSVATEECSKILERFLQDKERLVRESCIVALDMCEYENSPEFQYANTLSLSN